MNKRGQEVMVTAGMIVLLVLLLVFGGIYYFKEDVAKWIGFIPEPGKIDNTNNAPEVVGYDLEKNEIQYFNGKDWIRLDGIVSLNNKEVSPDAIGSVVNSGYFSGSLRQKVTNYDIWGKKMNILFFVKSYDLSREEPAYWMWWIEKYGTTMFSVIKISYGSDSYILNGNGVLYKYNLPTTKYPQGAYLEVSPLSADETEMVKKAIAWRDAPLENPQPISYNVLASDGTKQIGSENVCIKKYGTKLSIDISKDAGGGRCA